MATPSGEIWIALTFVNILIALKRPWKLPIGGPALKPARFRLTVYVTFAPCHRTECSAPLLTRRLNMAPLNDI